MKIIDGIVYAQKEVDIIKVVSVKALDNKILLISFNNNEERLFDFTDLLDMPAFEALKDDDIFKNCKIENGIITWLNGSIDIATDTVYEKSFDYNFISQQKLPTITIILLIVMIFNHKKPFVYGQIRNI